LAAGYGRKIADGVPNRWRLSGPFLGPLDSSAIAYPKQKESGTVLRNTKIEGPKDPSIDLVIQVTK
jgi:hypothetical protein